jgi:hypothetical protein
MDWKDDYPGGETLTQRPSANVQTGLAGHGDREITPTDGSVAGSGHLLCVFCAPCQRWIDCYEGVPPEVARERHGELFH